MKSSTHLNRSKKKKFVFIHVSSLIKRGVVMNAHVNNTFEVFFRALPVKAREVAIIEIPVILHYKIVLLTFGDF